MSSSNKPTSSKSSKKVEGTKGNEQQQKKETNIRKTKKTNNSGLVTNENAIQGNLQANANANNTSASTITNQNSNNNVNTIQSINDETEYNEIINSAGDRLVIVDFFADWCKPCLALNPKLNELAETHKDRIVIVKVNVDDLDDLVKSFDVSTIPTVVIMKNGKVLKRISGANKDKLARKVAELLAETDMDTVNDKESIPGVSQPTESNQLLGSNQPPESNQPLESNEALKMPSQAKTQTLLAIKSSTITAATIGTKTSNESLRIPLDSTTLSTEDIKSIESTTVHTKK